MLPALFLLSRTTEGPVVLPAKFANRMWTVEATVGGRRGRFIVAIEGRGRVREGEPTGVFDAETGGVALARAAYTSAPADALALSEADGVIGGEALAGRIVGFQTDPPQVRLWPRG